LSKEMLYNAFLSYSHAADDQLAPSLQRALERFARPFYRKAALRIFHDRGSLQLGPELWPVIREAIRSSQHFILLASPDAAESPWVMREIDEWLQLHDGSIAGLRIVLTSGEIVWDEVSGDFDWAATTALPRNLGGRFAHEPHYLDLRWVRTATELSLRHPVFLDGVATLAATLHGRRKDEMVGEDVRQYRRSRRLLAGFVATLIGLILLTSVAAVRERRAARREQAARRAAESASQSERLAREAEARQRRAAELAEQGQRLARTQAEVRRREAERLSQLALARALAAQSAQIRDEPVLLERSVLLAAEAVKRLLALGSMSIEADEALRLSLTLLPRRIGRVELTEAGRLEEADASEPPPVYLAWSRDRSLLAAARASVGLRTWSRNGLRRITRMDSLEDDDRIALSPAGDVFARARREYPDTAIEVGDVAGRQPARGLKVPGLVRELTVGPAGTHVAIEDMDSRWRLWRVADGREVASYPDAERLVFSPDGRYLAVDASSNDRLLRLPDAPEGPVRELAEASFLGFSADGRFVALGLGEKIVVEDLEKKEEENEERPEPRELRGGLGDFAALSAGGRYLATLSDAGRSVDVWDIATGREVAGIGTLAAAGVTFSPEGQDLAVASRTGAIDLWEVAADEGLPRVRGRAVVASFLDDAEAHHVFAEVSAPFDAFERGTPVITVVKQGLPGSGEPVAMGDMLMWEDFTVSADGRVAASAGGAGLILWDIRAGRRIRGIDPSAILGWPEAVALSPDGRLLVAASREGRARVWRIPDLRREGYFTFPGLPLRLAVSADGGLVTVIATAEPAQDDPSEDAANPELVLEQWDVRRSRRLARLALGTRLSVSPFALSPDGRYLATTEDQVVVRELPGGRVVARFFYGYPPSTMAFDRPGRSLAIAGHLGTVRVADVASGRELARLEHAGDITALSFSPTGRYLSTVDADGEVQVSRLLPQDLVAAACARVGTNLSAAEWEHYVGRAEPPRPTCPR
jgi:WD40 repeat protein